MSVQSLSDGVIVGFLARLPLESRGHFVDAHVHKGWRTQVSGEYSFREGRIVLQIGYNLACLTCVIAAGCVFRAQGVLNFECEAFRECLAQKSYNRAGLVIRSR